MSEQETENTTFEYTFQISCRLNYRRYELKKNYIIIDEMYCIHNQGLV